MHQDARGFSLVELAVVISIIGVLAGLGVPLVVNTARAWNVVTVRRDAVNEVRYAMGRMEREMRLVKDGTSILQLQPTLMQYIDVDSNTVQFSQTGTTLQRNGQTLLNGLRSGDGLQIAYFDANGGATTSAVDVRLVTFRLIVESAAGDVEMSTGVFLRNL